MNWYGVSGFGGGGKQSSKTWLCTGRPSLAFIYIEKPLAGFQQKSQFQIYTSEVPTLESCVSRRIFSDILYARRSVLPSNLSDEAGFSCLSRPVDCARIGKIATKTTATMLRSCLNIPPQVTKLNACACLGCANYFIAVEIKAISLTVGAA